MSQCDSWFAAIWIGGDEREAVQACREFCKTASLCVTVTPTTYVFPGGVETGVCVRALNYPRFPERLEDAMEKVRTLAGWLRTRLCQKSYTIETSTGSEFESEMPPAAR